MDRPRSGWVGPKGLTNVTKLQTREIKMIGENQEYSGIKFGVVQSSGLYSAQQTNSELHSIRSENLTQRRCVWNQMILGF